MSERKYYVRQERLPTKPVDILGLACSHGLFHYVCHALKMRRDLHDQETATHLLCCSMWALHYIVCDGYRSPIPLNRMTGSMRLVCEFLKRGANPNFYVNDFSATIWGEFLLKFEYLYPHDKSACAEITKVFVDHGANVHEIIYTEHLHVVHDISLLRGHAEWDPSLVQNFRTRHERTALYIFQESLSGTPDFEALENACQSKGAYSSSRATHIALTDENGYFRSYKMTDLQFSRFEAAFEIFDHFWRFWPRTRYQTAESIRLHLSHAVVNTLDVS